jgi:phosphohistidine phosphatase
MKSVQTSMDLILWRHAEAEDAAGGLPDACRCLTGRGQEQAHTTGRWLREHMPENVRILVSPTRRAQMTADALGLPFETESTIGIGAYWNELLAAADWPNHHGTVLIVGHQPTLGRAAAFLDSGKEADWKMKKGGLWWFSTRTHGDMQQTVLRALLYPNLAKRQGLTAKILLPDRTLPTAMSHLVVAKGGAFARGHERYI